MINADFISDFHHPCVIPNWYSQFKKISPKIYNEVFHIILLYADMPHMFQGMQQHKISTFESHITTSLDDHFMAGRTDCSCLVNNISSWLHQIKTKCHSRTFLVMFAGPWKTAQELKRGSTLLLGILGQNNGPCFDESKKIRTVFLMWCYYFFTCSY